LLHHIAGLSRLRRTRRFRASTGGRETGSNRLEQRRFWPGGWLLGLVLGLSLHGPAAVARPLSVDDVLATEAFGRVEADPRGRWIVFERMGRYDSAPRFDAAGFVPWQVSRLKIADLRRQGPARPLFSQPPGFGYLTGPLSPKGEALLVYRYRRGRWEAGLARPLQRRVRWWGLTPELALYGRTAVWRSERELLLIVRPDGDLPRHLRRDGEPQRRLTEAWATAALGRKASLTVNGSGHFESETPPPAPNRLLRIDVRSGQADVLMSGGLLDLEVSPDERYAAVIREDGVLPPPQGEPFAIATPLRRRRVEIVDLATGHLVRPCADCDVLTHLLAWSPSSDDLLVFGRRDAGPWSSGHFLRLSAGGAAVRDLRLDGLSPSIVRTSEGTRIAQADWLGPDPVVRAQGAEGRKDWYRISNRGPVRLTGDFPTPPDTIAGLRGDRLLFEDQGVWSVGAGGERRRLTAAGFEMVAPSTRGPGQRFDFNSPQPVTTLTAIGAHRLETVPVDAAGSGPSPPIELPGDLVAVPVVGQQAVVAQTRDRHGVGALVRLGPGRRRTVLDAINSRLADVDPPRVQPVVQTLPGGATLTSWLYLPPERPGARFPLVVVPYPGRMFSEPPQTWAPGELALFTHPALLASAGYAVLLPSLPPGAAGEPARGLADRVLAVVDVALQRGDLDGARLGVWGQSYGGYAALVLATQSSRFHSIIASASISDLASLWAGAEPARALRPSDGPFNTSTTGWVEAGAAGMGGPPWRDPAGYRENSPLWTAERITAPVLLVHGDLDEIPLAQAQAMFAAQWRQAKDAELLTYWGEGHVISSPANVRDLYRRVLSWLAQTLRRAD